MPERLSDLFWGGHFSGRKSALRPSIFCINANLKTVGAWVKYDLSNNNPIIATDSTVVQQV